MNQQEEQPKLFEKIVSERKFGIQELMVIQEFYPLFSQNMLGNYLMTRYELYQRVQEGLFGYEEFSDSLECFLSGQPKGCLKVKFMTKFIKHLVELGEKNVRA